MAVMGLRLAGRANLDRHCAWELGFAQDVDATREELALIAERNEVSPAIRVVAQRVLAQRSQQD